MNRHRLSSKRSARSSRRREGETVTLGTITNPEHPHTRAIEPKVKWATLGSYVSGVVVLALVNAFTGDDNALLIETLPDVIEPFILPVVPALVALAAGFAARHQWRHTEVGRTQAPGTSGVNAP